MIGDNALWVKIQQDYVETGTTYRELSEKYGVSFSTLRKKAAVFSWKEKRKEAVEKKRKQEDAAEKRKQKRRKNKTEQIPVEEVPVIVPNVRVDRVPLEPVGDRARFMRVVEEMMDRVEDAICVVDAHDAGSIRLLTAALKDLRELKSLNKTELDIEEQKARIAKLKSDTRIVETDESGGVVFMPVMDARPVPPEDKQ